jgi:hypothetical protein
MLEPQLDTLHIDPGSPVTAREIDRLLLLRFAIARRQCLALVEICGQAAA